ncbi:MAG: PAS domain S-box protein [Candidatus Kapabacteria bacterium]|nr:PAS domain S-box protein [Candidatus Kapabacteria bacterium]
METTLFYDYDLLLHEHPHQGIHEVSSIILHDAYRAALQQTAEISIADYRGSILYVNQKFCEMSQYSKDEFIGKNHRLLQSGIHNEHFFSEMWRTIQDGQIWKGEICNKKKNGDLYWVDTVIVPFRVHNSSHFKYLSIRFDITERKRAEQLLMASESVVKLRNEELERSQANLEEALEFVVHELKNPLGNILVYSELLRDELEGRADLFTLASQVCSIAGRTLSLIENFLNVRISDNKPFVPLSGYFNWYRLTEFLVKQYQAKAHRKDISITMHGVSETALIYADIEFVTQVMDNIFSNALKYTQSGKNITIVFERLSHAVECKVHDEGIGMDKKELGMLFTRYGMLSSHHKITEHSSGIGLFMTKKMVEAMNGKIWCNSELGQGTTFYVQFPIINTESFPSFLDQAVKAVDSVL